MRSPVETRCAGVADMCSRRLYQKESRGERGERFNTDCTEEKRRARESERDPSPAVAGSG